MRANPPKLSVLLPVHNGERFVSAAIGSILAQTFREFELILVDDGSTDATAQILDGLEDPRIRILRNDSNKGFAHSLNRGLAAVRGALTARMDADDLSHPDRFAEQVRYLAAHEGIGLVATDYSIVDASDRTLTASVLGRDVVGPEVEWRLFWENPIVHPSVMVRTELLRSSGGYAESFHHYAEDLDLWFRLARETEMAVLGRVLFRLRKHDENVTVVGVDAHIDEVVRTVQAQLATRLPYEPAAAGLRLVRWHPLKAAPTAADLDAAAAMLRDAYGYMLSRHRLRRSCLARIRTDLAHRLLRLARIRLPRPRSQALRIIGDAFSAAPTTALSPRGLRALLDGLLGPHGSPPFVGPVNR